eukprot:TRINITY_DN9494_c0_g1_i2.p1 TRINITY_DN9494_c0_g1~~TRINITY_DN9494_c0_g1_i2.p1  ORF type:complete len:147 (-),score=22.97 TRINITY_DN9494_c0_g1_i2:141-521(-)
MCIRDSNNFLRCGDDYPGTSTGYDDPNEWCHKGLRLWIRCINKHGFSAAIWKDPSTGHMTCLGDSKRCDFTLDTEAKCVSAIQAYDGRKDYLSCGNYQNLWGVDGYSEPNHYCKATKKLWDAAGWT